MKIKARLAKQISLIVFMSICLSSCTAYKNIPYMQGVEEISQEDLSATIGGKEPKIMPHDIISIIVNSEVPGAALEFNLPMIPSNTDQLIQTSASTVSPSTSGSLQNYIVNNEGKINFPVLGEIKISGLTIKEAQGYIKSLIYPKYISSEPIVNIRFINYEVSVLGEVVKPGIYTSKNGQMTILDAIAQAGDLTIYGKRNNVLLVRTNENGELSIYKINLQDKNLLLNKDLFYLQQNDKLYIQPNKAKGNSSAWGSVESVALSATLSAISILISVISLTR